MESSLCLRHPYSHWCTLWADRAPIHTTVGLLEMAHPGTSLHDEYSYCHAWHIIQTSKSPEQACRVQRRPSVLYTVLCSRLSSISIQYTCQHDLQELSTDTCSFDTARRSTTATAAAIRRRCRPLKSCAAHRHHLHGQRFDVSPQRHRPGWA
ncbi:hypothetical protein T440DRAFT_82823 [Plenodomus tracheiphilus IPT5]|uniref:Uncharacterized protein n=1 Tax=Plenodomus tracheiphilus IPT5 TaxID=1408161 RepID=A0A6A7B8Y3_9PLEO|nr:hypothetical protein T440DRAFT_82823 [Plenodomus tracheiphilus IPT5]